MNHYKVINRRTKKTQIFNAEELARFTRLNNFRDYAITNTLSPTDASFNRFADAVGLSCFGLGAILLITELIRNNYTIL